VSKRKRRANINLQRLQPNPQTLSVPEIREPFAPSVQSSDEDVKLDIKIDITRLTWGDVLLIMEFKDNGGVLTPGVVQLINRVVVGGVLDLPFMETVNPIMERLAEELEAQRNPVDSTGKN